MKEKNPKKSSEIKYKIGIRDIIRSYLTIIALTHKNVGALRMIIAYYFLIFAFISFWFTLSVPITSEFKAPEGGEKVVSRLISGGLTIGNFIVYGIMIAWKKRNVAILSIHIALIGFVLYLDVFLIGRIVYILIREGRFL